MRDILTLISVENIKLWKRTSTKVMIGILVLITLAATGIYKYYAASNKLSTVNTVSATWKEDLSKQLQMEKESLKQLEQSDSKSSKMTIGSLKKQIAEDEYAINNNIAPESKTSIWTMVTKFDSNAGYGRVIALFLIIACSALVAGEFSEGTMKMMISRPYSRSKIITGKLIATLLYGVVLLLITFLLNFIMLGIFFGFNGLGAKEMLWTTSKIIYMPGILSTLIVFALDFLQVIMFVILAFAISTLARSRSIATGFSLFMLLFGSGIIQLLAVYFSWGKYLPFASTDFSGLVTQGSTIYDIGLGFSIVSFLIYTIVMAIIGYIGFRKRDI
ncbi:ABC transporter permease subunit [Clostridium sp. 19966]|uniref:ABC transporter permease n=1 Tax=Clostridium sp. 19966 TaxID=2768166 RepID=UPI0028DE41FA|nr:ABC transporter permease subunit [Clostridium sp. 19966]MDT8715699.1 ABC transporter permease subunit [Clostridium sp. 19966]